MINSFFESSLEYLKGVGPLRANLLFQELKIKKVKDLIRFFPFRYIDRTKFHEISEIENTNIDIQLTGFVKGMSEHGFGKKKRLCY